jgi:rod shape-determining protein MreD
VLKASKIFSGKIIFFHGIIVLVSIIICCFLSLVRIPGMELLGITPNWFLILLVTWSVNKNLWASVTAAIVLGLIQDSLTGIYPSHVLSLVVVAVLTAKTYDQKSLKENIIFLMLIVFGMAIIGETITAIQYSIQGYQPLLDIWLNYQKNSLSSAIISSLWTPLIYYPLNYWWPKIGVKY